MPGQGALHALAVDLTQNDEQAPRLTVSAVAHQLGVAPATLRTWDRRYGLGPSEHLLGAHRRYSREDVARLQTMRRLTLEGVAPGEAARFALGDLLLEPGPAAPFPDQQGRLAPHPRGPGGSGGRVLALPGADAIVRGLGRAAMALDGPSVVLMLREQLTCHGVQPTWDHILRPVLVAVGVRWAQTGEGVEVEHLLSDCAVIALRSVGEGVCDRPGRRPVLLACAPEEQHALPLHALAAGLAERGIATRTLGQAMPAFALEAAVRRMGPAALFVWSQARDTATVSMLEALPVTRPATVLLVGGPGWAVDQLPDRVSLAEDLPQAIALVEQALGA